MNTGVPLSNGDRQQIARMLNALPDDLGDGLTVAVDVLRDLMQDDDAGPKIRLDAAKAMISLVSRFFTPIGTDGDLTDLPDNPMDSGDARARG